jgi:FkbM family methyltransferase
VNLIVDVGGNVGDFAIPAALANRNSTIVAFEPIPELREIISKKMESLGISNILIRPEAIGLSEGTSELRVSKSGEMGVSSLRDFNEKNVQESNYWKTRNDLVHHETISVEVIRLDRALQEMGFSEVDFLKIDAQGEDLNVLNSAANIRVKAGMLEVPTTPYTALYQDEPDLCDTVSKLALWDYQIYRIKPNDPANAEVNVYFCERNLNFLEIENSLSLKSNPIYSGKDYWWLPSSVPTNPAVMADEHRLIRIGLEASLEESKSEVVSQNQALADMHAKLREMNETLIVVERIHSDLLGKLENDYVPIDTYSQLESQLKWLESRVAEFENSFGGTIFNLLSRNRKKK